MTDKTLDEILEKHKTDCLNCEEGKCLWYEELKEAFENGKIAVACSCGDDITAPKCKEIPTVCESHLKQMCNNERQAGRDEALSPKGVYIEKALPLSKENLIRITEDDKQTIERLDEKLAALEAEVKEWKVTADNADRFFKQSNSENKKHFEYWKTAVKKNEELETEIKQRIHNANVSHNVVRITSEENARLRGALKEHTSWDGTMVLKPLERPTHGNCCTCQACGRSHDGCVCEHNEIVKALEAKP